MHSHVHGAADGYVCLTMCVMELVLFMFTGHPSAAVQASNMRIAEAPTPRTRFRNAEALQVRLEQSSAAAASVYAATRARQQVVAHERAVGRLQFHGHDELSDSSASSSSDSDTVCGGL